VCSRSSVFLYFFEPNPRRNFPNSLGPAAHPLGACFQNIRGTVGNDQSLAKGMALIRCAIASPADRIEERRNDKAISQWWGPQEQIAHVISTTRKKERAMSAQEFTGVTQAFAQAVFPPRL